MVDLLLPFINMIISDTKTLIQILSSLNCSYQVQDHQSSDLSKEWKEKRRVNSPLEQFIVQLKFVCLNYFLGFIRNLCEILA
jgi:hypothetical protein